MLCDFTPKILLRFVSVKTTAGKAAAENARLAYPENW